MQTKLGLFCERVMEAGWLMAAILAPLYFNVYSNRVFEPDKIALVRSIALIMSLAWAVKMIDGWLAAGKQKTQVERPPAEGSLLQRISRGNILALPTLALVIAYIISTLASVAPMITLWGSYQRLQGTYSTFSYIVIFLLAAGTIRQRDQLERVVSTIILTSVPIAIYGIVEHLKLEFLPWGGDVTLRVTSTMGNPIFIAAYLIMTAPLALGRFLARLNSLQKLTDVKQTGGANQVTTAILAAVQSIVWFVVIYVGLKVYGDVILGKPSSTIEVIALLVAIILSIGLPLTVRKGAALFLSAGYYGTVVLVGLATILFSQSRGPQLGLAAGLVVFIFLFAMKRNSRVIWYSGLALAVVALALLVVINIPNSPLSFVRDMPYIGRLAMLIEEGGSTTVRSLIWQGARELIGTHEPLSAPGYTDNLNAVRPLIGYGPDAMYVAYNRFYPPDLAHYEARNASPDRSHNETFDALVMTGILGYLAYWVVFYTVIYIGLIYLRVIDDRHGRPLYVALLLSGVVALLLIYSNVLPIKYSPGPPLLGVVVLGLYLVLVGIFTYDWKTKVRALDLTLIALVSAVVAHFVEIQFGIAIASTRTHFWLFAALIVVAGRLMDDEAEPATATAVPAAAPERTLPASAPAARPQVAAASFSKKKNKQVAAGRPRQDTRPAHRPAPARGAETDLGALIRRVMPSALPLAVVGGLILATMAYDFMLPPNTNQAPSRTTSVQFWLYFITWISCGLVVALDGVHEVGRDQVNERIASLIVYTAVSLLMWVGYVGLRSIVLSMSGAQIDPLALVSVFYLAVLLFGLLLAAALYAHDRPTVVTGWSGPAGGMIYAIAAVVGVIFIVFTNVNMVLADVQYKTGLAYDNAQRYDGSIQAYQSAIRLTPGQDFYYLFLGRSFMELARQFPERTATPPYNAKTESPLALARERLATLGRADMISASLVVLETARDLNVLNTDHYANLARLHRFWGETGDRAKFETADSYFRDATDLSPNNAQLWNEWAIVSILRGLPDDAEAKLNRSLELDDRYDLTYYYQGNLYMNLGEGAQDNDLRLNYLTRAADAYGACLTVTPTYWECAKARGYINGKYLGRSQEAVADFLLVAGSLPRPEDVARITNATDRQRVTQELININQNLAITYGQLGQFSLALQHAQIASNLAPQDQALKALVEQLKAQQK